MQGNQIRNAVKAIIIENGKILLCKYKDKDGIFYACIGGGQNPFEDMQTALKRECEEEITSEIKVGRMAFVRETYFDHDDGSGVLNRIHQIECFFECSLIDNRTVCIGKNPDATSVGFEWIPIDKLSKIRIFPNIFKEYIHQDGSLENVIYLGLTN